MNRLLLVVCTVLFFIPSLQAQFSALKTENGTPAITTGEGDGDEFENLQMRSKYWYERNAFPFDKPPAGAYYNAINYMRTKMSSFAPTGKFKTMAAWKWKNIGPVNIGGRIIAMVINPKNPKTMYAGAADGGVWKTIDEGKSWVSVSDNFPAQPMGALVMNPIDTNIVYAGTGEAGIGGRMFDGQGFFKTTNGGSTWQQVGASSIPPWECVASMAINPVNPDILYAAIPDGTHRSGEGGVWKSVDAGNTWTMIFPGIIFDVIINPKDPNVLYCASSILYDGNTTTNTGIFKTVDGGATWNKMNVPYGVADNKIGRTSLGLSAEHPEVVYAGVSEPSHGGNTKTRLQGIFRTTNAGDSWENVPVPFDYMVSQGWYDNIIGVDPMNPDIVFAGGVKLIRTSDGGKNWIRIYDQVQGGVLHVDQHAIAYNPITPDKVYIGNDGGVFRISQNGLLTEKVDYGLSITQFVGAAMHPTSDAYQLGGTQDNGTMNSFTAPDFDRIMFGDGGFTQINPRNPAIQYTTDWGLSLSRSTDFGRSWSRILNGFPPNEQTLFYSPYAMDPLWPATLYFGTSRIFKSTNGGDNWTALNNCMFNYGGCYYVNCVSVAPWDNHYVFAGATNGAVGISSDAGVTWKVDTTGLPRRYCSWVRSFTPGTVFAVFAGWNTDHVFVTTDYGNTWKSIQSNLPDIPVNDIFVYVDMYVVGTDAGVFISMNKGGTWQTLNDGMQTVSVQQLLFNEYTGTLRAVTHGRGMYDIQFVDRGLAAPKFLTQPDTTLLQAGQQFIYAAVANGYPSPAYKILQAPTSMTIDQNLGLVKWTAGDKVAQVTLEASNTVGKATQTFTLQTADVVPAYDWQVISSEKVSKRVMRIFNVGKNVLWLGHDTGMVSRSIDGGKTWKRMQVTNTLAAVQDIYAFDADTCFLTTEEGTIVKTTDGGTTWRKVFYAINGRSNNIHFFDTQKGIAIMSGEKDSADVFFTYDGGESWLKAQKRPYAQQPISGTLTFLDDTYGWFASSNRNTNDYADLLRTSDGGTTWIRAKSHCREISSISFMNSTTGYIVDKQAGIVERAKSGGSGFTQVILPMTGEANHTVQTFEGTSIIWIANQENAWISRDGGNIWTATSFVPTGNITGAVFADTSFGWAVSGNGIVQQHSLNPMVSVPSAAKPLPDKVILGQNYPNPISTQKSGIAATTIRFTIPTRMKVTLKIFNVLGNELSELVNQEMNSGEYYVTWDASSIAAGTYFYQLTAGANTITRSMVVMK